MADFKGIRNRNKKGNSDHFKQENMFDHGGKKGIVEFFSLLRVLWADKHHAHIYTVNMKL